MKSQTWSSTGSRNDARADRLLNVNVPRCTPAAQVMWNVNLHVQALALDPGNCVGRECSAGRSGREPDRSWSRQGNNGRTRPGSPGSVGSSKTSFAWIEPAVAGPRSKTWKATNSFRAAWSVIRRSVRVPEMVGGQVAVGDSGGINSPVAG